MKTAQRFLLLSVSLAVAAQAQIFTSLLTFQTSDGSYPNGVILGSDGNFYGATTSGGASDDGTIFQITPAGVLTTIYTFTGTDGMRPDGLTLGTDGNFYGTTSGEGDDSPCLSTVSIDCGSVFKLTPGGVLKTLAVFGGIYGLAPNPLTEGADGNFYGATELAGNLSCAGSNGQGCGTLFQITPAGTLTVLHTFGNLAGDPDGASATFLTLGADGDLYGPTAGGGNQGCVEGNGCGTIFKVSPAGAFTTLHVFNGEDGSGPDGALVLGPDGNFYGTTIDGGTACSPYGCGTVYKMTPAGTLTTLLSFDSNNGDQPFDKLTLGADGNFYGTTSNGVTTPQGTIFSITPGGVLTNLHDFDGLDGSGGALLVLGPGGTFYATTFDGGGAFDNGIGSFFSLQPCATGTPACAPTLLTSSLNPSVYGDSVTLTAVVTPASGQGTPTGTVDKAPASVTLRSSAAAIFVNQSVTFSAVVTGEYGGSPSGTVTFSQNGTAIGSPISVASRQASITTSFAIAGTYSITAVYSGDSNYNTAGAPAINQAVDATATTTTTLKTSGSPSLIGQKVTFTATVKPSLGSIPNGETVTFRDGASSIGTGNTTSGVATFSTSSLAAGPHSITAVYPGDATYGGSTSAALNQVISKNATTTLLSSNLNPATYGESVTFTAKVTSAGTPTGSVAFKNGSVGIGTATLSGDMAIFITKILPAGTDAITAIYTGDASNGNSTSAPINEAVNQAPTTTAVTSSRNPSNSGQSVTFSVTVSSANATPGGTVTFTDGSTTLGSVTLAGGRGALTTTTLPVGSDVIKATYGGSADFTGSSASLTQTVNQ